MALLVGHGVTKRFGKLVAVDHVDFVVERDEIVGLIGPNGAGKSTLVNLITGLETASDGALTFDGCSLRGLSPPRIVRLGLARTFQIAQPFRTMTARQNVAVAALFRQEAAPSVRAALREADAVLESVGLGQQREQPARALTTPDLRRLELAKGLALRPRLMLLDEVMAGLTPAEIDAEIALLREINTRGIALVVIEHVLRAVTTLSHRVIVLHHGRKLAEGQPDVVMAHPEVVSAYLGSPARARSVA